MTAPHIVEPARVLGNLLTNASPDMMRSLLQKIRYLDKLVDELARGKSLDKILRS